MFVRVLGLTNMDAKTKLKILLLLKEKNKKKRRYWIHPILVDRQLYGEYHHLLLQILSHEDKCIGYIRMRPDTFDSLLILLTPHIEKKNTNYRQAISPQERLVITLRYLASEESMHSLAFHYRVGLSTVHSIVRDTTHIMWKVLHPRVMMAPNEEAWLKIAEGFYNRWDFPLCLGSIDGKDIRIKKPWNSGSKCFNYKAFFSIVLLAVVDGNGQFVIVDVGSCGGNSDGGIFERSQFRKRLANHLLHVPNESTLPGTNISNPFVFVADDVFPLKDNIMKPFPQKPLTYEKEVFNFSRARGDVEMAFGNIAQMWRKLLQPIDADVDLATDIVNTITVLHNFVKTQEPHRNFISDAESLKRVQTQDPQTESPDDRPRFRASQRAIHIRDTLMNYFLSDEGKVSWQDDKVYSSKE